MKLWVYTEWRYWKVTWQSVNTVSLCPRGIYTMPPTQQCCWSAFLSCCWQMICVECVGSLECMVRCSAMHSDFLKLYWRQKAHSSVRKRTSVEAWRRISQMPAAYYRVSPSIYTTVWFFYFPTFLKQASSPLNYLPLLLCILWYPGPDDIRVRDLGTIVCWIGLFVLCRDFALMHRFEWHL